MSWRALILALASVVYLGAAENLAAGKILVATRRSQDADLSRAVVLLVHYDRDGAIGLILNRPSKIPLAEVMPELRNASMSVFAGGPVAIGVRALLRSTTKPDQATPVVGDVWMISTKSLLAKLVNAHTPSRKFRIYAGYTGWTQGQLQNEVELGLWSVRAGDASTIFDPTPESLRNRLTEPRP